MKKSVLLVILLGQINWSCGRMPQSQEIVLANTLPADRFVKALNYVKKSEKAYEFLMDEVPSGEEINLEINVGRRTEFIYYISFIIELAEDRYQIEFDDMPAVEANAMSDSLMRIDDVRKLNWQYSFLDMSSMPVSRNALAKLFFSNPYENSLAAELLVKGDNRGSYDEMTGFNTGFCFLFYFGADGNIEKVYSGWIRYD